LHQLAFGKLGMTDQDFWNASPRDLYNRQKGYNSKVEEMQRNNWERTRWQTLFLLNIQLPKGKDLKLQDLAVFPWEKKEETHGRQKMDDESINKIIALMDNPKAVLTPIN
jgi:Flp pilus assembly protein CpaB